MLGFYLIFVLAVSYSPCISADEISEECLEQEKAECSISNYPEKVPATSDELRDVCRSLKDHGDCVLRVRDRCLDNVNKTSRYRHIVNYMHESCSEDSEVYQVISSNIACISSVSENITHNCRTYPLSDSIKALMMNLLREYHATSRLEVTGGEDSCLEILWNIYCPSVKASIECGMEAGAAVKDVLINTRYSNMCRDDFVAAVTPMLETIEAAIIAEELLKKVKDNEEESPSDEARR